jgi:hypothetical protein
VIIHVHVQTTQTEAAIVCTVGSKAAHLVEMPGRPQWGCPQLEQAGTGQLVKSQRDGAGKTRSRPRRTPQAFLAHGTGSGVDSSVG